MMKVRKKQVNCNASNYLADTLGAARTNNLQLLVASNLIKPARKFSVIGGKENPQKGGINILTTDLRTTWNCELNLTYD